MDCIRQSEGLDRVSLAMFGPRHESRAYHSFRKPPLMFQLPRRCPLPMKLKDSQHYVISLTMCLYTLPLMACPLDHSPVGALYWLTGFDSVYHIRNT